MTSFENFIDEIKQQVDLSAEIEKTAGFALQDQRRGKYVYGIPTAAGGPGDSLMVDLSRQTYTWWKHGGNQGNKGIAYGDVFDWLVTYRKMEFMAAVKYLCREYNIDLPEDLEQDPTPEQISFRARSEMWDVVTKWLSVRLVNTPAALEYARCRGWTDETIKRERLGFAPGGKGEELEKLRADLRNELSMYGYDLESPRLVAILGLKKTKGELREWSRKYHVDIDQHPNWIKNQRIYGMLDFPRLVYPHIRGGKVTYFSSRNLEWQDGRLVGQSGKHKTWNLPRVLAGKREFYFNDEYYPRAERVVVVEGPADAITWGQWGVASVSLIGLGASEELVNQLRGHETLFLGMDNGAEGRKSIDELGPLVGPGSWVLYYPTGDKGEDANAWLQAMIETGAVKDCNDIQKQAEITEELLENAELFALRFAKKAGKAQGPDRIKEVEKASLLIRQLDENTLSQYHKELRTALGFATREFNRVLTSLAKDGEKKGKREPDVFPTLGGVFGDWLLEYCYDPEENKAMLAYRNPEGKVGMADDLLIDGLKYIPKPPNKFIQRQAVLFPSSVGPRIETKQLVGEVEKYINKYYLMDDPYLVKIIAYYVLLTWIYDAFEALPYLRAVGDYGSGKSELMKRVGYICYRLITASGANTSATFFRTKEMYGGTVFIDEADLHDGGDMANDIVKFLNLGAMKGNPITRMVESLDYFGNKVLEPEPFDTFGPKLIAMREDFRDKAVGSRSLTIHVVGKSAEELLDAGVPIQIDDEFRARAIELRNKLLRWRLEHFVENIELSNDLVDVNLSARLNQVTMAVKALAKIAEDKNLLEEITKFLRAYAKDEVREKSLTMQAYIVEAMWELWKDEEVREMYLHHSIDGRSYLWMHDIRERANTILDSINEAGSVREESGGGAELTPQGVSHYLREGLQVEVGKRQGVGVPVYWVTKKMIRLGKKYGVLEMDFELEEEDQQTSS